MFLTEDYLVSGGKKFVLNIFFLTNANPLPTRLPNVACDAAAIAMGAVLSQLQNGVENSALPPVTSIQLNKSTL